MVVEPFEVVLPVRPVKNPIPFIAPGGDCGPCAVCAALGWDQEQVADIYRLAKMEKPEGLSLYDMQQLLHALQWEHRLLEFVDTPLLPRPNHMYPTLWGYPSWTLFNDWLDALRVRLEAGWLGLTMIDFDGRGPVALDGEVPRPRLEDGHFVLLTGARARWVPRYEAGATLRKEVRVTDSSTRRPDEWWCEVGEFLLRYGGFRVIWLRAVSRCARPHSS